jgi:hypothetical protein
MNDLWNAYSEIPLPMLETEFISDSDMMVALKNTFVKNGWDVEMGDEMAHGGETYGNGGELVPYIIWVSKGDDKRELYGEYKSQRAAEMAMKKLWDRSDYVQMGNKPKSMYEKEGLYAEGGAINDFGGTTYSTEDLSGMFAKGGSIKNQYKGRSAEDIWDSWTISQRVHFLKDHYLPNLEKSSNRREYEHAVNSISEVSLMNWNKLPSSVHSEVERHIFMGQYAHGGETHRLEDSTYAKGGGLSKYKYKVVVETKFEKHDVGEFASKGDALICLSALQQKAPSDYKYKLIEK